MQLIRCIFGTMLTIFPASLTLLHAHEPVFGFGPHTIFRGGIGIETALETEIESHADGEESDLALHTEVIYGVTSELSVTLAVPFLMSRVRLIDDVARSSTGLNDLSIRAKFRFWRKDTPGVQIAAALLGGIKFPTGDESSAPRLGSGSTDYTVGLALARESRRWYHFMAFRYRVNGENSAGFKVGNRSFTDIAFGVRPWLTDYLQPDLVCLIEFNLEKLDRDALKGQSKGNSGGKLFFISPAIFLTYRNIALKGGLQFPLSIDMWGEDPENVLRHVIALELHL